MIRLKANARNGQAEPRVDIGVTKKTVAKPVNKIENGVGMGEREPERRE